MDLFGQRHEEEQPSFGYFHASDIFVLVLVVMDDYVAVEGGLQCFGGLAEDEFADEDVEVSLGGHHDGF